MAEYQEIVLVTGANTGIGFEIARKLLEDYDNQFYVLLGCRNNLKGAVAAQTLHDSGLSSCEMVEIDNNNPELIDHSAKVVEEKFGRLDVLILNAAIAPDKDGGRLYDNILATMTTNVAGSAKITEAFAPLISKSNNPRVVFMSSKLGSVKIQADENYHKAWPAYASSKSTLNSIMLWFAHQYPDWKVNACCPGFRATAINNYGGTTTATPGKLEDGAVNAVRLAALGKDGETATFTQRDDETGEIRTLPW